jgi:hypothetical protein
MLKYPRRTLGGSREPVSRVLPLGEVTRMSEDDGSRLSSDEKEERGPLAKVCALAPLLAVILQLLELILRLLGVIQ